MSPVRCMCAVGSLSGTLVLKGMGSLCEIDSGACDAERDTQQCNVGYLHDRDSVREP